MRAAVIVGSILLAATPSQASESCMSKAEARQHFGTAPLYWHGPKHCWDAASNRSRRVVPAVRSINPPIPRPADPQIERQIERQALYPRESEAAAQMQEKIDAPKWRNAIAKLSDEEPVQLVVLRYGDVHSSADDAAGAPQSSALAWLFIATAWLAVLSLILHDVTKEDSNGSAVVIAARRLRKLPYQLLLLLREIGQRLGRWIRRRRASKGPAQLAATSEPVPAKPIHRPAPAATIPKPAPEPPMKRSRAHGRAIIRIPELEAAIGAAVKQAAPGCEAFVGVVVRRRKPGSRFDANWEIRGAKFGQADRMMANEALATIVERMQKEFRISES
jgi:hypothetical protein